MRNNLLKKGLVVGIILLFIGIAVAPSLSAQLNRNTSKITPNLNDNQTIEFIVTEFKSDGTKEDTILELSHEQAIKLIKDLKVTINPEEKLSLFKNYGFIPEYVTLEQLRLGMEEKTEINGLNEGKLGIFGDFLKLNLMCSVFGCNIGPFRLLLGSSAITRALNTILFVFFGIDVDHLIRSIDLLNCHIGFLSDVSVSSGVLPDFDFDLGAGIIVMVGFVGYYIHGSDAFFFLFYPFLTINDFFWGYATFFGLLGNEWPYP